MVQITRQLYQRVWLSLPPALLGGNFSSINGMMMGFSREEMDARLDDILKFADIGEFVNQPCKTYSSGMFVRLAFAVAINIDPEILIVDEALSVGDVFFQAKCYHKFEEFKEMGKTIVFVSHDLSSISKYCDRVVLLNQGVKLGEGSPKEMIDADKQVQVAQYVPAAEDHSLLSDKEITAAAAAAAGTVKGEVNPELLETSGEQVGSEGCLSVPGKYGIVKRPNYAKVRAYDRDGNEFEVEGEELMARCFCHELDHLDGIVYTEIMERYLTEEEMGELSEEG